MSEEIYNSGEHRHYGMPWSDPFDGPTFCDCEGKIHVNLCGTTRGFKNRLGENEALKETYRLKEIARRERLRVLTEMPQSAATADQAVRIINVYFHVVYSDAGGNVTNEKLQEQIAVLNRDYQKQNSDVPDRWANRASDTHVGFSWDPANINRVSSPGREWSWFDEPKFGDDGGSTVVSPESFLNLWVCDLGDDLLGYAQFPDEAAIYPQTDGVVLHVDTLPGGSFEPYDLGRTAVHEVGHYLNLLHTWGDGDCSVDDGVSDTPESSGPSYGCELSRDSCPTSPNVDMVENYMDYSDDACLGLFTYGQRNRITDCLLNSRTGIWQTSVSGSLSISGVSGVSGASGISMDLDVSSVSGVWSGVSGISGVSDIAGSWYGDQRASGTWTYSNLSGVSGAFGDWEDSEGPGTWGILGVWSGILNPVGVWSGSSGVTGFLDIAGPWSGVMRSSGTFGYSGSSNLTGAQEIWGSWANSGVSEVSGTWGDWGPTVPAPLDPPDAARFAAAFDSPPSASICEYTLAYSLKKDYFGETSAWRNIQTFTREYLIRTAQPMAPPVLERIKADIVAEINSRLTDARDVINIISIDVPTSSDLLEGLVNFQKITVVYEQKTLVVNNTDFASASTYGTLHANYLAPYVSDIDAFNESFDLEKGDSGEYTYTHNVSFTAQDGTILKANAIAKIIGQGLLSSAEESSLNFLTYTSKYNASLQVQNIYANGRKIFSETYDTLKNTYSFTFTLKFRVGKDGGVNTYSYIEKYSMDMDDSGISKVTQTLSILGASSFADALGGLTALMSTSYARCNILYEGFKQHDGADNPPPGAVANTLTLDTLATSTSVAYLRPSLQIEYSCSFSDSPSRGIINGTHYTREESVSWNIDERGVSSIEIDVALKSSLSRSTSNALSQDLASLASVSIVSLAEANPYETSLATLFGGAYASLVNIATIQINANGPHLQKFSKTSRSISVDQLKRNSSAGGSRSLSYKCSFSNDPINNRAVCPKLSGYGGGVIRRAEVKISTNLPSDSVKEFNIIGNRTILSYPFSMTEGSVSIVINMILKRPVTSRLGSFQGGQYAALTNPIGYRDLIRQIITQVLIPETKDIFIHEPRLAGASEGSLSFTKISFSYTSAGEVTITSEAKIKCKKSLAYAQNNRIGSIIV